MERRKEIIKQYKEMKFSIGVYQIKNKLNGKIFVGISWDTDKMFNRCKFQLDMGTHMNKELQREWKEFGADNFSYEVLELLKYENESKMVLKDKLVKLEQKWIEKLQPFGEKGYNKQK